MSAKPPLGLIPRYIAEMNYCLDRGIQITLANQRYVNAGLEVPDAWIREYKDLIARHEDLTKRIYSRSK